MSDPVEQIFAEVAEMKPPVPVDEDPYQSEEYQKFVESMVQYCHCCERNRPCDSVLAGGICDGVKESEFWDSMDDDDDPNDL